MLYMEINPIWRHADILSVEHAAALLAGFEPLSVVYDDFEPSYFKNETGITDSVGILDVKAAFNIIRNAVKDGTLPATIRRDARKPGFDEYPDDGKSLRPEFDDDGEAIPFGGVIFKLEPNWAETTVSRSNLVEWLKRIGLNCGFFFPKDQEESSNTLGRIAELESENARLAGECERLKQELANKPRGDLAGKLEQAIAEYPTQFAAITHRAITRNGDIRPWLSSLFGWKQDSRHAHVIGQMIAERFNVGDECGEADTPT